MGGTGIADPEDIKSPERIEIDDVVKYIKTYLIAKIREYFTNGGFTYSPNKALGTDAYEANNKDRDKEAHSYWDDSSTLVQDVVGKGRKGTPITAADVVKSVQSIVKQLARFRVFSKEGKIKYSTYGVCSSGDCYEYGSNKLKSDPSIPAEKNMFFFLPAKSDAYTSIKKTVGNSERKDAVVNTLDTFSTNVISKQPKAGQVLNADAFKSYIAALLANWKSFIEANVISYYSEKCYKSECNFYVSHCYDSCDGRSRR